MIFTLQIAVGILLAVILLVTVLPALCLAFIAGLGVLARVIVAMNKPITFKHQLLALITRRPTTERERCIQGLYQLATLFAGMLLLRFALNFISGPV